MRHKRKAARQNQRVKKTQVSLHNAIHTSTKLRDERDDIQSEFANYKYNSESTIQHWKDQSQQLEHGMAEQQFAFDRKNETLFKELHRRERGQQAVADAQEARITDYKAQLDTTRSELQDTRNDAQASRQQASSLTETITFATAEHHFHMQHCVPQREAQSQQLTQVTQQRDSLVESLDFATTEHRLHMEVCQGQHTADSTRAAALTAQVSAERSARHERQQEYDGLDSGCLR